MKRTFIAGAVALLLASGVPAAAQTASRSTEQANRDAAAQLPADREDEDFAARGFVATRSDPLIKAADGRVIWNLADYDFLRGPAPATVHPSLWRHTGLLARHGLFKVSERIYQVRGFDISNITIIEGDSGFIVIDPLTTVEVAQAAMALARAHLGDKPVRAVIYTHSHGDHFGGARGVVSQADIDAGRVQIIAPDGFLEHAVGENVIAGPAMSRRAIYQFGLGVTPGALGVIGSGIGTTVSTGTSSLVPPTRSIMRTGETLTLDGLQFEFQMTPNTEAPAELNFYLPQLRALCMAENANASMHNVLTPRGALVRDAKSWADYLTESERLFGGRSDVVFMSHGWPRWGTDRIGDFLTSHRDAYKFLHDQSVRLMNLGFTGHEIAERIALPPSLANRWFNRGYYGTMRHNSRAVYQRYMGWYDGNPARLNSLPPEEASRRYVAAMGGERKVKAAAARAAAEGDYRWAAELLDRLLFGGFDTPQNRAALAEAHRQLGFQAESAIWRNMYLSAARELEQGVSARTVQTGGIDVVRNMPTAMLFDLLSVRLDPAKAGEADIAVRFAFPERRETFLVRVRNGVLVAEAGRDGPAVATITGPRAALVQSLFLQRPPEGVQVDGDRGALARFFGLFDAPKGDFPIVTP